MGKVSMYYIANRLAVNNLLGLVSHSTAETSEPELGN